MQEIKSVRVRRIDLSTDNLSSSVDYKVTLFGDGKKNFKVGVFQPGRSVLFSEYKKDGRFKKFSNDDFIKSAINTLISSNDKPTLLRGGGSGEGQLYFEQLEMDNILNNFDSVDNNIAYKIIQDPWLETPPPFRNFGFDPYYINNGSSIIIRWLKKDISGRTINSGGFKWSDDFGNELSVSKNNDSKKLIYKTVEVISPDNSRYYVNFQGSPFFSKGNSDILNFSGEISDITILSRVLNMWIQNVFTKIYDRYSLEVCKPNYKFCDLIPYIDPIESGNIERLEEDFQQKIEKKKLNVIIPKDLKPKVKEDISFKIFLGDPPKSELLDGFDFGDEEDLSDLLLESEFDGLSEAEVLLQEEISSNQESFDKGTSTPLPDKINISISSNLDDLLRDAGKAARVLGKNPRVKYENLRIGYKKGIHGLCPQGTQAVLVAMTGIKELGLIRGNADWFSFKNPATGGKPWANGEGFDKLIGGKSYYNSKVKIEQINGSWKGTYLQNSNMWQVGDIIVCGYTGGKLYGHIQIWTGYSWMSDFKQNAIQQRNVDPNTVALWRFNQNGLELLKNKRNIA